MFCLSRRRHGQGAPPVAGPQARGGGCHGPYAGPDETFWRVTFPASSCRASSRLPCWLSLSFDDFIITNFVSGDETTFPKFVLRLLPARNPGPGECHRFSMFLLAVSLVVIGQIIGNRRRPEGQKGIMRIPHHRGRGRRRRRSQDRGGPGLLRGSSSSPTTTSPVRDRTVAAARSRRPGTCFAPPRSTPRTPTRSRDLIGPRRCDTRPQRRRPPVCHADLPGCLAAGATYPIWR